MNGRNPRFESILCVRLGRKAQLRFHVWSVIVVLEAEEVFGTLDGPTFLRTRVIF
jgi:hypothetical protein